MHQIARKTYLAKHLKRMQKLFPEHFDFFPRTWVLPIEMHELQKAQHDSFKEKNPETNQTPKKRSHIVTGNNKLPTGFTMIVKPDCLS
jgi:hypothetical protein